MTISLGPVEEPRVAKTPAKKQTFFWEMMFATKQTKADITHALRLTNFNDGHLTVPFSQGMFVNHFNLEMFTPLSLCGTRKDNWSTSRIVTLLGMICPTCKHRLMKGYRDYVNDSIKTESFQPGTYTVELIGGRKIEIEVKKQTSRKQAVKIISRELMRNQMSK